MKNNIDLILPLLDFDKGSHHVQIIQRAKDGHKKSSNLICEWFINSESKLLELMDGIVLLCNTYNARCYINLNAKNGEDVTWIIAETIVSRLKSRTFNPLNLFTSAHDTCTSAGRKYWIVDIDNNTDEGFISPIKNELNVCRTHSTDGRIIVAEIPTKTGIHLVCNPFNEKDFKSARNLEIKVNSSTILYCL